VFWIITLITDYYFSNPGQKLSFSYDKVFDHNASQENVFVEISQLVQSALDGYKVNNLQCLVIPNECFIEYELLSFWLGAFWLSWS
jgi:hypothetical protein